MAQLVSSGPSSPSLARVLRFEPYSVQTSVWPATGRHVLAQYDAESVVVYQAFRRAIADEAVALQRFGPAFSLGRMSWIKPGFLWMMYRSGWASKVDQERVLAVRVRRAFFERVLAAAVASSFHAPSWPTHEAWQTALRRSDVRLQWDPDHGPGGQPVARRAIQLGLPGAVLAEYAGPAVLEIEDVTGVAHAQRVNAVPPYAELVTPRERVMVLRDAQVATRLGSDAVAEIDDSSA